MTLAIVGTGLVSPLGLTPAQHAFFARARLGMNPPSAFLDSKGDPAPVYHCPWLGAKLPIAERLAALGQRAVEGALGAVVGRSKEALLFVCLSAPRPGLTQADRDAATRVLAGATSTTVHQVRSGAASFFDALSQAEQLVARERGRIVVVVAIDSFVSLEMVRSGLTMPAATWVRESPALSEASAAVAVMNGAAARELGVPVLGTIHHAGTRMGTGTDDDDATVDGSALTALIEEIPDLDGPIRRAYGQDRVDLLRQREWTYGAARNADRFHLHLSTSSIEVKTGRVGAAAGAVQLVHGIAAERHYAGIEHEAGVGPFLAWAISQDGRRGICVAQAAGE